MPRNSFRRDFSELLTIDPRVDGQGFLRTTARAARAGVQDYYEDGKLVREYRPPAEVEKSVRSLSIQVVTLDHTDDPVNINNRNAHDIGSTGNVTYEDGWVSGEVVIRDKAAIQAAQTTHKQLSVGYHADVLPKSGVFVDSFGWQGPPGKVYPYDRVQTNIRANHIALVPRARAGSKARLDNQNRPEDRRMKTISIGGTEFSVEDAIADEFGRISAKNDSADTVATQLADAQNQLTQANTKITMLEAQIAKGDKQGQKSDAVSVEVQARLDAYSVAAQYLPDGTEFDSKLTADEWKVAALQSAYPEMNLDGMDVDTAFTMLQSQPAVVEDHVTAFVNTVLTDRATSGAHLPKTDAKIMADAQKSEMDGLRGNAAQYWKDNA